MSIFFRPVAISRTAILMAFGLAFSGPRSAWADPEATDPPAEKAPPAAEAEAEPEPDAALVKGLSWDVMAGGIPVAGSIIQAELGITGLPRVSYHYSMRKGLSIGGAAGLDWAYYQLKDAHLALTLQGTVRYTVMREGALSIGIRADPGLYLNFDPSIFGIMLNFGGNVGYTVDDRMIVGGGIDVPAMLAFASNTTNFTFPLLFGPIVEYHVSPPLAVTLDAKIGPHFNTGGSTLFGIKVMAGIAYRL